jgi:peptidyl-prolyl cis-trans isomerase C
VSRSPQDLRPKGLNFGEKSAPAVDLVRSGFRAVGKVIATVWRLARALDSALWRGLKFGFGSSLAGAARSVRLLGRTFADLARWLPTRGGRAYTAFSGIILIIAALWILDELRVAPASQAVLAEGLLRPPASSADPIVARIDGRYVHLSEVRAAAIASGALDEDAPLTAKAAFDRRLVEAFVDQRLLSRAAAEAGLPRNPEVARQLLAARDRILAAALMRNKIATSVTEDAARKLYNAQADATRMGEEVRARHILVAAEEDALQVVAALDGGADFAELAKTLSVDVATAEKGGDLGFFNRAGADATLAAVAFSTSTGVRAAPFQTEAGWHVLEVTARRSAGGVAYADVRDEVKRYLRLKTIESTLKTLKDDSEVVYYSEAPRAN